MKMKVLSRVFGVLVFSISMFALAEKSGSKAESDSGKAAAPAPQMTQEERVKKAEAHEALAACLRTETKTLEECHKVMAGSCGESCGAGCGAGCAHHPGGPESCPMKDQTKPKKRGK